MSECIETISAAEQARLALVADCDQRWAAAAESLWDVSACLLLDLEKNLTRGRRVFLHAVTSRPDVADVVANLAALALDELVARARVEELERIEAEAVFLIPSSEDSNDGEEANKADGGDGEEQ